MTDEDPLPADDIFAYSAEDIFTAWPQEFIPSLPPPNEVLHPQHEQMPAWLEGNPADLSLSRENLNRFLSSRVVYFPGSADDGHAVKLFGGANAAHCFVHADSRFSAEDIRNTLDPAHDHHLMGYAPVPKATQAVTLSHFAQNLQFFDIHRKFVDREPPTILWSILERDAGWPEEHGPKRIAFLHFREGLAEIYWNLWARRRAAPYAIVLQNEVVSPLLGNDSLLHRVARRLGLPNWLLVDPNTHPWRAYVQASDFSEPSGPQHRGLKLALFRRQ